VSVAKHIVSIKQFQDTELLEELFEQAAALKAMDPADYPKPLTNKVIATLFYEPSTRTRLSFETAITRLGGGLVSTENAGQFSSAAKGETLQDTIRTLNGYVDGIVLRHPMLGAAQIAADYSQVPIVNAGDGAGEHPTQALLDLFTIKEAKDQLDGLKIGLVGDLLNGRTIHSLIHLLKMYKADIYCIAPDALQLPKSYQDELAGHDKLHMLSNWDEVLPVLDVLYITRIQKERFEDLKTYERVKDSFVFDAAALAQLNQEAIIMHPLPRVNEISPDVDKDKRALYFEQARNGLFVRMALVAHLCGSK
jgi:aspartate carbamoyltransferase catalytic subunit